MTATTEADKLPIGKILTWVLTTVAGGLIGILLKYFWEAPRPVVELLSVELASVQQERRLNLTSALVVEVKDHFYFPRLNADVTTAEILEAIQKAELADSEVADLGEKFDELIAILNKKTGTLESRRQEFLVAWASSSELLTDVARAVVGDKEGELPARYQKHPPGTETLTVSLWPGRVMDLAELDERVSRQGEAAGGGSAGNFRKPRQDAHLANLLRRLWIYLEPDVLIPILQESKRLASAWLQSSRATARRLKSVIALQNPSKFVVKTLVTNRGMRPLPIRSLGILKVSMPSRDPGYAEARESVPIKLTGASDNDVVTVIDGGKSGVVSLVSIETAQNLVEANPAFQARTAKEDLTSSRLQQLYDGGGLSASVVLAQAGADESGVALRPSDYKAFGPPAEETAFELLLDE